MSATLDRVFHRDQLHVYRVKYKLPGELSERSVFQVGPTPEAARVIVANALERQHPGVEIAAAVRATDKDIPMSERLFDQLEQQRRILTGENEKRVEPSGPFFSFVVQQSGEVIRVFEPTEDPAAARLEAETLISGIFFGEEPAALDDRYSQQDFDEFCARCVRGESAEIFSVLPAASADRLARHVLAALRARRAAWARDLADRIDDGADIDHRNAAKGFPKPTRLEAAAVAWSQRRQRDPRET